MSAPNPGCPVSTGARPGLVAALRDSLRNRHYSLRTERAYVLWVRRFVLFHGRRNPRELGAPEVTSFLSSLANHGNVAASTQNQALAAILFLYREVLGMDLPWLTEVVRARRPRRMPTVLTQAEVQSLLGHIEGLHGLMARLMYGTGMRISECVALRVKDLGLERREIIVREGKGGKDRVTMLPASLLEPMRAQLVRSRAIFEADRRNDVPGVELPHALARKHPGTGRMWGWHWVFPQDHLSVDPRSRVRRRHHYPLDR